MTSAARLRSGDAPIAGARCVRRRAWLAAGLALLVLGCAGVVLPLLPAVDCWGLAAICFARADRRWEARLLHHPVIGPLILRWRNERAVPRRAKVMATLSMTASCGLTAVLATPGVAWIPAVVCLPVAVWLWSRPESHGYAQAPDHGPAHEVA